MKQVCVSSAGCCQLPELNSLCNCVSLAVLAVRFLTNLNLEAGSVRCPEAEAGGRCLPAPGLPRDRTTDLGFSSDLRILGLGRGDRTEIWIFVGSLDPGSAPGARTEIGIFVGSGDLESEP